MTKTELFIKLAQPNENGVSRWVDINNKEYAKDISIHTDGCCPGSGSIVQQRIG